MIESEFEDSEGAQAVGFFHGDFGFVVEALDNAAGELFQLDERLVRGVTLIDGGTQGMALRPHISNGCRLLVIDAVDAGEPPGTSLRFEGEALRGLRGGAD